ncbi:dynamin-2B-like isoform X2 [Tripterygium wilfordii]|uniref:Dynamin-2B-like isoform X2 n=1 Tax=Tripterygium wilfordii TaxID=458696 RepID=A0A7J7CXM7_TRIWF|nr:dynamin-2B-like isoform X2 [Tripterygium wilfordii]
MLLRMERQRGEEELKNRRTKKEQEAEQATLNRATSPQTGAQQTGGSLKSMKDKSGQADNEEKEGSALKTAGPEGEITAGRLCCYVGSFYRHEEQLVENERS